MANNKSSKKLRGKNLSSKHPKNVPLHGSSSPNVSSSKKSTHSTKIKHMPNH